jgi:hypothetical protein
MKKHVFTKINNSNKQKEVFFSDTENISSNPENNYLGFMEISEEIFLFPILTGNGLDYDRQKLKEFQENNFDFQKEKILAYLKETREYLKNRGFKYSDSIYDSDDKARENISLVKLNDNNIIFPLNWTLKNNEYSIFLSVSDFQLFFNKFIMAGLLIHNWYTTIREEIKSLTTIDEIKEKYSVIELEKNKELIDYYE